MIDARVEATVPAASGADPLRMDLHLQANPGVTAIFGPHAAGKTLLFEYLAGLRNPDKGRILVNDRILFDADSRVSLAPGARSVGMVFERNCLLPHMTLRENLFFAASSLPPREAARRAAEMLERFGLADVAGRLPRALNPAEHRVGMIAQALIRQPRALLVDAIPTEWDPAIRVRLFSLLRGLAGERGIPILLATRRLDDGFEAADTMLVLRQGKILQQGPPVDLVRKPASLAVAELLGEDLLIPAEIVFLDPQNRLSRLSVFGAEIPGPYFAGHFKGSRLTLCVAPSAVECTPRAGETAHPGHIPLVLQRAVARAYDVRLYFEEGLVIDLPEAPQQALQAGKRWQMGVPPSAIRVL